MQFLFASPLRRDVEVLHSNPHCHILNAHCTTSPLCYLVVFSYQAENFLINFNVSTAQPQPLPPGPLLLMCFVAVDSCRSRSCGCQRPAPVNEDRDEKRRERKLFALQEMRVPRNVQQLCEPTSGDGINSPSGIMLALQI